MKKNLLSLAAFLCLLTSCTKSVSKVGNSDGSLVQFVSVNKNNDSLVANYSFDNEGYLLKISDPKNLSLYPLQEFTRDDQKRIIKISSFGSADTLIRNVYYASGNEVSYSVQYSTKDPSKLTDSTTYEYENGRVARINYFYPQTSGSEQPQSYYTYEYTGSNISTMRSFYLNGDGAYSESWGVDLEYDDKINPLFTHDDIFVGLGHSPNNVTLQTNHYPGYADDYVVSEFDYDVNNKPISVKWSGPSIETMHGFYFYK